MIRLSRFFLSARLARCQPFFVATQFTGRDGRYVSIRDTVRGFRMILDGELDHIPEEMFRMAGSIEDVLERYDKAEA